MVIKFRTIKLKIWVRIPRKKLDLPSAWLFSFFLIIFENVLPSKSQKRTLFYENLTPINCHLAIKYKLQHLSSDHSSKQFVIQFVFSNRDNLVFILTINLSRLTFHSSFFKLNDQLLSKLKATRDVIGRKQRLSRLFISLLNQQLVSIAVVYYTIVSCLTSSQTIVTAPSINSGALALQILLSVMLAPLFIMFIQLRLKSAK